MTVEFSENAEKELEKTEAMFKELGERIAQHRIQYAALGRLLDRYDQVYVYEEVVTIYTPPAIVVPSDEERVLQDFKKFGDDSENLFKSQHDSLICEKSEPSIETPQSDDTIKSEPKFECTNCGVVFGKQNGLSRHINSAICTRPKPSVGSNNKTTNTKVCPVCTKVMSSRGFWMHIKTCVRKEEATEQTLVPEIVPEIIPEPTVKQPENHVKKVAFAMPTGRRKCLACGIGIEEGSPMPYCSKCWKLTKKKGKHLANPISRACVHGMTP
jgi:uncharacterized C2H2 Zn-finger protein